MASRPALRVLHTAVMLFVCLAPTFANSADTWPYDLIPSFVRDARICKQAFAQLREISVCRAFDARCPAAGYKFRGEPPTGRQVDSNLYGYTYVYQKRKSEPRDDLDVDSAPIPDELADSLPNGVAIIFVGRYQGDRVAQLLETWKVNEADLDGVLALPLPDVAPNDLTKYRDRNAAEFEAVLRKGERLSKEWSPAITIGGKAYIVERECSGTWAYGGDYVCNKVIKLTVKRIEANQKSPPYCELSLPPRSPPRLKTK